MSEPSASIPTSTLEYYQALPVPEWTAPRPRYWLHGLLLAATCFTTLVVGARMQFNFSHNLAPFATGDELIPFFPVGWVLEQPARLLMGIPFSATLLLILLAHEMGHYLFCRRYGVWATLPFFLPAPTLIGTLGAVIRIKGPIRSRAALFDIGIAGPIAGFAVAVVTLFISMFFSKPLHALLAERDQHTSSDNGSHIGRDMVCEGHVERHGQGYVAEFGHWWKDKLHLSVGDCSRDPSTSWVACFAGDSLRSG